ncbi:Uncharacterised protein [Mycobacterium tuberculosis]|nr:Uncharacterised protein [Mycobacterium tuberculosis]
MNPHESPEATLNSWLLAFCIFFAAGSCYLGSVEQWHQTGPAMVAALFLVMCGRFVAAGKTATPDAESDSWRALALMTAIAGGLIFSELSFVGPLFRSVMHVPERGDSAAGWFMIAAMAGMGAFVILLRRRVPQRVEGLNAQVALSAAAAAGASGAVGLILLALFCLGILWVVLTRAVDITGVLASATLPLLAVLAALPLLFTG